MSLESEQGCNVTFVLGGARSGKSKFAEDLVLKMGLKPIYLATGRALDEEMGERIAIHQERRGAEWETVEEPLALVDALQSSAYSGRVILVDCLSLWVTNLMMAKADVAKESAALAALLGEIKVPVVLVSNEVGMGIIPDNAMARRYMDLAGDVNQRVAHAASEVYFVVSGMPLKMK
ncbi:MAG: bifunctional adenosylcobinamide kinase/adenosylcobinamide-phosphate guanylyltransferase [Hyphomicrobiales bacterium]|nr:MAG: bifunctional adenosylcobinamide kinase/adenosylcobinamide-phosphate guanylyltransferase [Hyphomicrobiales bacterium]